MEGVHLAGVGNFLAICWGGGWKINNSWSRGGCDSSIFRHMQGGGGEREFSFHKKINK